MKSLFHGKRVAITGPAPHIITNAFDASQFDIIVRLNLMIPLQADVIQATSNRCDVWYPANTLLRKRPDLCFENDVKVIRISAKGAKAIPAKALHKVSYMNKLSHLRMHVKSTPNRGIKAIADIILDKPKLLYITGFTFYTDGSYYPSYCSSETHLHQSTTKGNIGGHDQEEQLRYFQRFIAPLPFVKTDEILANILSTK